MHSNIALKNANEMLSEKLRISAIEKKHSQLDLNEQPKATSTATVSNSSLRGGKGRAIGQGLGFTIRLKAYYHKTKSCILS